MATIELKRSEPLPGSRYANVGVHKIKNKNNNFKIKPYKSINITNRM